MKFVIGFAGAAIVALVAWGWSISPVEAGKGTSACVQGNQDGAIAFWSPVEGTLGDAFSDGLFGNEPNLTNTNTNDDLGPEQVAPGSSAGFVVGSASPGPATIGGGFLTLGEIVAPTASLCSTAP